jgi:hypothetical protein
MSVVPVGPWILQILVELLAVVIGCSALPLKVLPLVMDMLLVTARSERIRMDSNGID